MLITLTPLKRVVDERIKLPISERWKDSDLFEVCVEGDEVVVRWWQYAEADRYEGRVTLSDPGARTTEVRVPADAKPGDTLHLILEATDDGDPALTRYRRVVVTVGS